MDAGNENIGKIKAAWMGSNSSFQGKEQGEWRGGEGKKKRWRLRWRESSANKKRWGWLDRKCDACVSKCTQRVGQTNLICDERAVQPRRHRQVPCCILYAHDTYRSLISSSSRQFLSVWLSAPAWRPDTAETEGILHSSLSHPSPDGGVHQLVTYSSIWVLVLSSPLSSLLPFSCRNIPYDPPSTPSERSTTASRIGNRVIGYPIEPWQKLSTISAEIRISKGSSPP